MRKFGLIGFPLSHSFSQKYFSEKFQREHIVDCAYEKFSLPSIDMLPALLLAEPELHGLNVTIPYKEQVIPFLDHCNEVVSKIRACNCIHILKGKLYGFNTDTLGFEQSLKKRGATHSHALILGTGGAAKAVAYVLQKAGMQYKFVSRNPVPLSAKHIRYGDLTESLIHLSTLIVNTTPVGMFPQVDACPDIPYEFLTPRHFLFDLIYNPASTLFLQKGEEHGATIQNGTGMLVLQAEESWKIWNGLMV